MANTTTQKPMGKTGTMDSPPVTTAAKTLQSGWGDLQGKARLRWSQLTDDDFKQIGGRYEMLVESLQRRYGFDRARAEQEIDYLLKEKEH